MKLNRKDSAVAALAILIVGVFIVAYASSGVAFVGESNRWAAVVILVLGLAAGFLSSPGSDTGSYVLGGLVVVAFLFAVLAMASGSLTALALLVVALLALIGASTARHALRGRGQHIAT